MDKRIEKIYAFIQRNCHQPLSLDLLAEKAKLSPFYFQRLFKKEMNETPAACINRVRLEKAAHLLKAGIGNSIAQVADECGFSSAAVFNRSFKAYYKTTPVIFSKQPSTLFPNHEKKAIIDFPAIDIMYLPDIYLYGVTTSIMHREMMDAIELAIDFCQKNRIEIEGRKMGVLTHHTMHYPAAKKNYYLGISVHAATAKKYQESLFLVPKGKYASFTTSTSVSDVREVLKQFTYGWLNNSPYMLRDLVAYEEFLPGNDSAAYPYFKRRVYVPVQLK